MAPLYGDVLDYNIVFEYQYDLIVGSLGDIRGWVYAHQPDPRPECSSVADRQHWLCPGGDAGFPLGGRLRLNLTGFDPMIFGLAFAWARRRRAAVVRHRGVPRAESRAGGPDRAVVLGDQPDGDIALGEYSECRASSSTWSPTTNTTPTPSISPRVRRMRG